MHSVALKAQAFRGAVTSSIFAPVVLAFAALLITACVPHFGFSNYTLHVLVLAMIWSLFGLGWNVVAGFAGTVAFGHQAFFAIGAYGSALLVKQAGLSPWLTMWLAALIAAIAGVVVAIPVLRIRSVPQVAIVTLAFAEIIRILIVNLKDVTGGESGLIGIRSFPKTTFPLVGTLTFGPGGKIAYFYFVSIILIAAALALAVMMRSRIGLAITAIKNSQDAAESLGVDASRYRIGLFGLSAFIVGLAGAFYAHFILVLAPAEVAGPGIMIMVMAMTIIGGIGTIWGPIIGAFMLTLGIESFRAIEDYRLLLFGAMIVVSMRLFPSGLVTRFRLRRPS